MSLLKSVTLYGLWASGNVAWLYRFWERALVSRVRVVSDQTLYVVRKDHCVLPRSARTICRPISKLLAKVMVWWHTAVLPGSTDECFRKCCGISLRDFPALKGPSDLTAANFETLPGVRICSVKTSYHHRQVCYFRQTYFHTRSFRLEIRSSKAAQDMRERMFRGREGRWRSMLLIFFCMWVRAAELPEDSQMTISGGVCVCVCVFVLNVCLLSLDWLIAANAYGSHQKLLVLTRYKDFDPTLT